MGFVGDIIGDITGSNQAAEASKNAANTQAGYINRGIDESTAARKAMEERLSPWVTAGGGALGELQKLLSGDPASLEAIRGSPIFSDLVGQSENALLQNASATGGLRGGNTQDALANNRSNIFRNLLNDRIANLSSLSSAGQNAATGVGNAGLQTAANNANMLSGIGNVLGQGQIAAGNTGASNFGTISNLLGGFVGAGGLPGLKKLF